MPDTESEGLGYWSMDPQTGRLEASAACKRNHGRHPHEDLTYEEILASVHPGDRERVRLSIRRAMDGAGEYEERYRVVLPSGEVRWIRSRGQLLEPTSGGASRIAGATLDITGCEQDQEEKARLVRREEMVLAAAGEGICGLDASGMVTFANPAAERLVGRQADELTGKSMHEEVHHTRADGSPYPVNECPLHETLRDGAVHHSASEIFWRADGTSFPVEYRSTPILVDGEVAGAVVTFSDITGRASAGQRLRESEERYRTLFDSMDEGYGIAEVLFGEDGGAVDLRWLEVNPQFETQTGLSEGEVLSGKTVRESYPEMEDKWFEIYGRVALTGEPVRFEEYSPSLGRWFDVYAFRIGEPEQRRVASLHKNVTARKRADEERERARERATFLSEASRRLADSLDWGRTLSEITRLAVPRICDLCIVDTLDAPANAPANDESVRRLAAAHKDTERERLAWELERRYPMAADERNGIAEVIRTGESMLLPEITEEWLQYMAQDDDHLRILRALNLGSIVIVPLIAHGRAFGAITLASDGSGRPYDAEDLALAEDLGRRAAQSMDNARLYEEQSHAARTLQQSLLPPSLPGIPGVQSAARFRPAASLVGVSGYHLGGDFYDMYQTPAGWAVVVGDVMGKGVEAAELTAMVRYTLRTAAMTGEPPSAIVATLNAAMLAQRSDYKFCTLSYGLLNPPNETPDGGVRLTLCRGGHPPPLLLRADGTVEEAGTRGLLVGVEPDPGWSDTLVELAGGDSAIFYTDGLTEARNPRARMFGERRLKDLASSCRGLWAEEMADTLERGVLEFQEGEISRDDVAILIIQASREKGPA